MYSCLNVHSHYSLLHSIIKAKDLTLRAKELGIKTLALTDYGSMSGAISFIEACEKQNIHWIVGAKLLFRGTSVYTTVLARNLTGWKNLIKMISATNLPENLDRDENPTISFELLKSLDTTDLICIFEDGYNTPILDAYRDAFKNFWFGLTIIPCHTKQDHIDAIREKAAEYSRAIVALPSPHYLKQNDFRDHHVLVASKLQSTMAKVRDKCEAEQLEQLKFFECDEFHLPSNDDMNERGYTEEELRNTQIIADFCEAYNVFSPPRMPSFPVPPGAGTEIEYLTHLCRQGWLDRIAGKVTSKIDEYVERVRSELAIIEDSNLASYFLIVADYVNWVRSYSMVGAGRGSVGGSLVAYLTKITDVDPIKYNLIFSRFYNAARKGSLPDIDIDFPACERDNVINYIRDKYGRENTCQIATFGRLSGRGMIREVLRIHAACAASEITRITRCIPEDHKISDELQAIRDDLRDRGIEDEEPSVIMWALQNNSKELKDWCYINRKGTLEGPLSLFFEQAIRLENTLKSQGKHAAAVLISNEPIVDICPLIADKDGNAYAGFDHRECEKLGLVKIDVLSLTCLDKLLAIEKLVNERHFKQELVNA